MFKYKRPLVIIEGFIILLKRKKKTDAQCILDCTELIDKLFYYETYQVFCKKNLDVLVQVHQYLSFMYVKSCK